MIFTTKSKGWFIPNEARRRTSPWFSAGFTIIELLVVITIVGLLLSIIFASLTNARIKARDAKRLSDMRQVVLGLEFYENEYGHYPPLKDPLPPLGDAGSAERWKMLKECLEGQPALACPDNSESERFMSLLPEDPLSAGTQYDYSPNTSGSKFVLKARLERDANPALETDVDGVQSDFSSINCADPSYCLEI